MNLTSSDHQSATAFHQILRNWRKFAFANKFSANASFMLLAITKIKTSKREEFVAQQDQFECTNSFFLRYYSLKMYTQFRTAIRFDASIKRIIFPLKMLNYKEMVLLPLC